MPLPTRSDRRRDEARALERRRSKLLDAPTWLWSAVVELVQLHEGAYLEHCRRFALPARFSASGQRRNRRSGRNAIAK